MVNSLYWHGGASWRSEGGSGQQLCLTQGSPAREDSERRGRMFLYLEASRHYGQCFLVEMHMLSNNPVPPCPPCFCLYFHWFQSCWGTALAIQFCMNLLARFISSLCVCSNLRHKQCQREAGSRTCFCRICQLTALSHALLSFCFNQAKMLTHKRERLPWRTLNNSYSRWITLPTHRCDRAMRSS